MEADFSAGRLPYPYDANLNSMVPSELPASSAPPLSKEEQKRSLESNLDELLERYLLALNQYQVLQKGISSSLATV